MINFGRYELSTADMPGEVSAARVPATLQERALAQVLRLPTARWLGDEEALAGAHDLLAVTDVSPRFVESLAPAEHATYILLAERQAASALRPAPPSCLKLILSLQLADPSNRLPAYVAGSVAEAPGRLCGLLRLERGTAELDALMAGETGRSRGLSFGSRAGAHDEGCRLVAGQLARLRERIRSCYASWLPWRCVASLLVGADGESFLRVMAREPSCGGWRDLSLIDHARHLRTPLRVALDPSQGLDDVLLESFRRLGEHVCLDRQGRWQASPTGSLRASELVAASAHMLGWYEEVWRETLQRAGQLGHHEKSHLVAGLTLHFYRCSAQLDRFGRSSLPVRGHREKLWSVLQAASCCQKLHEKTGDAAELRRQQAKLDAQLCSLRKLGDM